MEVKKVMVEQIDGLHEASRLLNVTPNHLRCVIRGERQSEALMRRAEELGIKLPIPA